MEAIAIDCVRRQPGGKGVARRLRAEGRLPAVLYGHGIETTVPVSLDPNQLITGLKNPHGANALFTLTLEGFAPTKVLVRELFRDPVSRQILHVDLQAIDLTKERTFEVSVSVSGRSPGVVAGGKLRKPYREVKLLCLPELVPSEIVVDISNLDQNESLRASDLSLPEGVKAIFDRDYVVVKISKPRGQLVDEEEEEGETAAASEE